MADLQSPKDRITLRNGYGIPCLGFGTWKMPDGEVGIDAVHQALHDGYRHIDTAAAYDNEGTVGKALASGGVSREDVFVTTKVWNTDRGYDATLKAFEESRAKLHLDYVDLYLIHWPAAKGAEADWQRTNQETWRALETLYLDGLVRAIGVSNFKPHHLEPLMDAADILPMVDQIELHPGCNQEVTRDFCNRHDIVVEAWSPLGSGRVLENQLLIDIAARYGCTGAAVPALVPPAPGHPAAEVHGPVAHRRERTHLLVQHHRRGPAAHRRAGSPRPKRPRSRRHRLLKPVRKARESGLSACAPARASRSETPGRQRVNALARAALPRRAPSGLCRIVDRVRLGACALGIRAV